MNVAEPKTYASEAAHAYWPDGRPCYNVPYKDKKRAGQMRRVTITDIRELKLIPSSTTILKVMAQPGLAYWTKTQIAKAAFDLRPGDSETQDEWVDAVLEKAEKNMSVARDKGSEIHGVIEKYLGLIAVGITPIQGIDDPNNAYIHAARRSLQEIGVFRFPWHSEKSFASPLGFAGKIDLHGEDWVVDFKSIDNLEKRFDYPDRCAQIASYLMGKFGTLEGKRGWNIAIGTNEPGTYKIREWSPDELAYGWKLFSACKTLWGVINRYET